MGRWLAALLAAALAACGGRTSEPASPPLNTREDAGSASPGPEPDAGSPDGGVTQTPDGGVSQAPDGGVTQTPDAGLARIAVPEAGSLYHGVYPTSREQKEGEL